MSPDRGNAALWAFLAANVVAIFILPYEAFVWQLVVDLIAGGIVLGFKYIDADQRADREADANMGLSIGLRGAARRNVALKREVRRIDSVRERVVAENHRLLHEVFDLHLKLTEAQRAAGVEIEMVLVPLVRVTADDPSVAEWDAILRATGDRP